MRSKISEILRSPDKTSGQVGKIGRPYGFVRWPLSYITISAILYFSLVNLVAEPSLVVPPTDQAVSVNNTLESSESASVVVNDLEFKAVAQSRWMFYGPQSFSEPIMVQLWITNRGKEDLIFPAFDSFRVMLIDPEARKIQRNGGRLVTTRPRPIRIRPGKTHVLCRDARLEWAESEKFLKFTYFDGTGSGAWFSLPGTGRYSLQFECTYPIRDSSSVYKEFEGTKVWNGSLKTKNAHFEVIQSDPRTRSFKL